MFAYVYDSFRINMHRNTYLIDIYICMHIYMETFVYMQNERFF